LTRYSSVLGIVENATVSALLPEMVISGYTNDPDASRITCVITKVLLRLWVTVKLLDALLPIKVVYLLPHEPVMPADADMLPTTLNNDPLNVKLLSTLALGEDPFSVMTPLSVVPVKVKVPFAPDVPELPEVPFAPDVPELPRVPDVPELPEVPFAPDVPELPLVPFAPEVPLVPDPPAFNANDAVVANDAEVAKDAVPNSDPVNDPTKFSVALTKARTNTIDCDGGADTKFKFVPLTV